MVVNPRPTLRRLGPALFFAGSTLPSLAATIQVTGTGDAIAVDGTVTLREAITSINNGASVNVDVVPIGAYGTADQIAFQIPGAGARTIGPTSALPALTKPVLIDGYTQPGAARNTLAVGTNAVLLIELDGTNAGALSTGLLEMAGGNSTITGLVINRGQGGNAFGLRLLAAGGNSVKGNYIGLDPSGTVSRANGCNGLRVESSSNNVIGGLAPGDRNVISATGGCGANVALDAATNNQFVNNYIGTNASGTAGTFGGGIIIGSFLGPSTGNVIGGTTAAARNVISGNNLGGVVLFDMGTSGNLIRGNFIGTNAAGTLGVPNSDGVRISNSAHDNTIGGTAPGAGNTIAFNSGAGVSLASTFGAGPGNAILGNSIFSNGALGIDLGADGVTLNDAGDGDSGPNNLQNFPVVTGAAGGPGPVVVQGTLNSAAGSSFRIEFFSSTTCDASGYGEGASYLGSTTAVTDGGGNAAFTASLPAVVAAGSRVTATATDSAGDTSEFSACFTATAAALVFNTLAPCRIFDTRDPNGPYGGPAIPDSNGGPIRGFVLAGQCGVPSGARAVSVNIAVTQPDNGPGVLTIYPGGASAPLAATINYQKGQTRANNAIVPLGGSGDVLVYVGQGGGTVHLVLDVNGFFQ